LALIGPGDIAAHGVQNLAKIAVFWLFISPQGRKYILIKLKSGTEEYIMGSL